MPQSLPVYLDRTAKEVAEHLAACSRADPLFAALRRLHEAAREAALEAGAPSVHPRRGGAGA